MQITKNMKCQSTGYGSSKEKNQMITEGMAEALRGNESMKWYWKPVDRWEHMGTQAWKDRRHRSEKMWACS